MARRIRIAIAAAVFAAAIMAAQANSPEPTREAFAALARTCTADGAFGHRFGERSRKPGKDDGIAPFFVEMLSSAGPHDEVFEITAAASFAHAPMSQEDRVALAGWVVRKLDSDFAAGHKTLRRQPRADGVAFIADTFVLDLSLDGTTVHIACTDIARKKQAREDMRRED